MKKIELALSALFALATVTAFADEALTLPRGVLRTTLVLLNGTADEKYDADGKAQDLAYKGFTFWNAGIAFEYGVTDTLTAAVQWVPGYTFSSSFDADGSATSNFLKMGNANLNSLSDLFIGAKYQFVGPKAIIPADTFRVAAATGLKAALPSPDFEGAATDRAAGDDFTLQGMDKNTWGFGGRFYADWVPSKLFYLNLYSEYVYFLEKDGTQVNTVQTTELDIDYGWDLTLEIEPHVMYDLNKTVQFEASVPVTYKITPELEYDGVAQADTDTTFLKVGPKVGAFIRTAVPFDLSVQYQIPVAGTNANATSALVFRGKVYVRF